MHRKVVYATLAILALLSLMFVSMVPTDAWVYPDCTEDDKFELFGPRLDRILIKLYADLEAECMAMEACEIDIMDWKPPPEYFDKWFSPPYNETIKLVKSLCNLDEVALDINNNETLPDGSPNPCSVSSFRHALAHLVDRDRLIWDCFMGWAIPMYTEVPCACCLEEYCHPEIWPGGALEDLTHPYDPAEAERLLDADGFPINPATGWRFWDMNGNGIEEPGEYLVLFFVIPIYYRPKWCIGELLADELEGVNIRVERILLDNYGCHKYVMVNKYFHLYIGDRNLRKDPDYLYGMKHSQMYWHPGVCPNYIHFSDPEYDMWAEKLKCAATQAEAVEAALMCQEIYATPCKIGSVPICMPIGYKAMKRCYTGTPGIDDEEDIYECQSWKGIVNGYWDKCSCGGDYGINSWWTFLNAYPEGHPMGDCAHMTMRYGFMKPELIMLNPIYSSEFWDWEVLNKIYDTLIKNDPYHKWHPDQPQEIPWMAKDWTIDTWEENKTRLTFYLSTCATWHDGVPFTSADVKFTIYELPKMLEQMGLPPPWWHMKVKQICDVTTRDPCTVEILFDCQSIWALHWIGTLKILPKHIWKPLIELHCTSNPYCCDHCDITGFAPDPNLIGTGPYRLKEYEPYSHIELVANKPSVTITTNLPCSQPVHSPYGYFRWCPVHVNIHTLNEYAYWGELPGPPQSDPVCSRWHQVKGKHEHISTIWHLVDWIDYNENGILDQDDAVLFDGKQEWETIFDVEVDPGLDLICIWTDWYSQKIYPCDDAAFGITLHNQWLNPIPNTAWPYHEQVGELWVDKIVKLSVEQILEFPPGTYHSGTEFPPSQWLHFQENTEVHIQKNTTIHVLAGAAYIDPIPIPICQPYSLAACENVLFKESTVVHWIEPGVVHIELPTKIHVQEGEAHKGILIPVCEPFLLEPCQQVLFKESTVVHWIEPGVVHIKEPMIIHVLEGEAYVDGMLIPLCEPYPLEPCQIVEFMPSTVVHWLSDGEVHIEWEPTVIHVLEGIAVKDPILIPVCEPYPLEPCETVVFQPSTEVHWLTDGEVHINIPTTIHVLAGKAYLVPILIPVSVPTLVGPCHQVLFLECTEVHLPNGGGWHWKHPTEVQIKPTENIVLPACYHHKEIINLHFKKCHYDIKVMVHIKGPPEIPCTKNGKIVIEPNPWLCQWINCTYDFWATIKEDIGRKWFDTWHEVGWYGLPPAGHQLQIPDCKVDMQDVAKAAKAFGAYPGHPRWEPHADITGPAGIPDFEVDMRDIATIARKFGWLCP